MFLQHVYVYVMLSMLITCEILTESYENHLGTKTPYRTVANKNDTKLEFKDCIPQKIWMLVRHGTRNPSAKVINKMQERLSYIRNLVIERTNLNGNVIKEELKKWKLLITDKEQKRLTHEGEEEMLHLAERMHRRFPDILNSVYSNSSYKIKFTATQRTEQSAKYFAAGLFGVENASKVWFPQPLTRDPILRFYKLCNKWRKSVKNYPKFKTELYKFRNTTLVNNTIKDVNLKLGFTNQLKFDDVFLMYQTCAFETAWNEQTKSPWCQLFNNKALKVMEYHEDLKYYWVDGYGYNVTYEQACPTFNDMLNFLKTNRTEPKAVIYFTHSGTILKMLAHLNLYKDLRHLVHMDHNIIDDRQWRVSKIDAFGSNLAFVLHKCKNEVDKVLLLHQEHIVRFPSCPSTDLCEMKILEEEFSNSINNCNFDQICDNKNIDGSY